MPDSAAPTAEDEVVDICRHLIRIDSSNYGDGTGPGERAAAEHVAGLLSEVGLEPELFESADKRTSLAVRWEGEDPSRPSLLIHGHLDVVPAEARDWTHDPFAGEIVDGCVWGRGAVDMKDMDAMVLSVVRQWRREGRRPPRDVVLCFLADEEAGGKFGAHWMVDNHPEQFDGVTEAISEVGGFSFSVGNERVYLVETAQKGIRWLRLVAEGRAGHGSMVSDDNAVTALAEAVARIGRHDWPVRLTPTVQRFLEEMADVLGIEIDPQDPEPALAKLGTLARIVGATLRNTANPTMLRAGYKHNVIPQSAEAFVD
ncbi:MAG TPA: M20/M25/M40 family metallo-hydrolase, partial [Actinomycetes bacterium]|nr:M20/M25/M40 family metallo-hydrolase [Actinomycetes bacterium]